MTTTWVVYVTADDWRSQANSRTYYSLEAAKAHAQAAAASGETASVEEYHGMAPGKIVWSSGGKG